MKLIDVGSPFSGFIDPLHFYSRECPPQALVLFVFVSNLQYTPNSTAATIGFIQSEYSVVEDEGVFQIGVGVLEGELGTFYTLGMSFGDGTTSG